MRGHATTGASMWVRTWTGSAATSWLRRLVMVYLLTVIISRQVNVDIHQFPDGKRTNLMILISVDVPQETTGQASEYGSHAYYFLVTSNSISRWGCYSGYLNTEYSKKKECTLSRPWYRRIRWGRNRQLRKSLVHGRRLEV